MKSERNTQFEILPALFDLSGDLLVQTDESGTIIYVSPAARRYGYDPREVVGTSGLKLLHPNDRENAARNLADLFAGVVRSNINREHRLLKRGGGYAWVEGNPVLQRDANGRMTGVVNIFRDITDRRRSEAKSRRQALLLEAMFEDSPVAKLILTLSGGIKRANPAFCRLVNRTMTDLVGMPVQDLIDGDRDERISREYALLFAGVTKTISGVYRLHCRGSEPILGDVTVSLLRNSNGKPWRLIARVVDVTETRRLQADLDDKEAQFRLIAETIQDVIVLRDRYGRLSYVSPAIRNLGYEPAELLGKTFAAHIHPEHRAEVRCRLRDLDRTDAMTPLRWRARHARTGNWIWMESSLSSVFDPISRKRVGVLDVMRNIDAKVTEEAELSRVLSEAARLSTVKAQFLSNINHEFRTPITTILGFCELMQKIVADNAIQIDYLQKIRKSGWRLVEILDDLFDIVDLETAVENQKRTNVSSEIPRDILQDVVADFSGDAEKKGVILEIQEAEILNVCRLFDRHKLQRILRALVSNAVKFSDAGTITLRADTEAGSGDMLVIEVEDQGCGISVDGQTRIFESFIQIDDSATRRHGGIGVGLAIASKLAEVVGGRIELQSEPGVGSCFRVVFPAPLAVGPVEDDNRSDGGPLETVRVLVVDDSEANRHMFSLMLGALGAEVTMAENGQVAVDLCETSFFDLVLMDIHMPVLDGPAALKKIREGQGSNADIPVVAFTAGEGGGDLRSLAQFNGVVRKPVEIASLVQVISDALAGATKAADELAGRGG